MENQRTQQRIKMIYQMLFEKATGNFSFRIIITDQNDELDKLSEMLNKLAGEMHEYQKTIITINVFFFLLKSKIHELQ